ncbi:MAG: aminotransferase class I/II-fold pyridoxal phosphate-dependent enzyme [Cyclobacteriaceae bacterium]|nr:aminotransferase class I/II-fold pyridoxal phosphate-dependent enzyme [Cyclobacteriaceae bacterium]MCH8515573.1 aminotransferase class I/II-fold pyridoxal phosphate-dependent enzyme [Cyclobacteriaceae bacterium]
MQQEKIWLSSPHMGGTEEKYVREAFETNWIAPLGPNVDGFEKDLCRYVGVKSTAAVVSGTAAIHLGLRLLGVEAGDEVICQSMTFVATANAIKYQGAIPTFMDSEAITWNLDPDLLHDHLSRRKAQGKRVAAVIPVHLYGMPAQMNEIRKICEEFEVPILEDAAEALGSFYNGKACGSLGDMAALSFNGNKIITTSGGGALLSNDEEKIKKARYLSTQARQAEVHFEHTEVGYNYRMSNISAGIGRGQMEVLSNRVLKKRAIHTFYTKELEAFRSIRFLKEPEGSLSNRWLSAFIIEKPTKKWNPEAIRLALDKENIESRPLWKPMHLQPVYKNAEYIGRGVSDSLFANGLCLPSDTKIDKGSLERIITIIKGI